MVRILFWLIVVAAIGSLVFFALQKEVPPPPGVAVEGAVTAGEFAPGKLQENYLKYGYQFRDASQEQFWMDAQALLNAPLGRSIIQRIKPNGDIHRFRIGSGEYAVMNSAGQILVYLRTDYAHWVDEKI